VKAKAIERGVIRPEQAERMSNRDALNLIFVPGFSTASAVTSLSGRGVGMDVVRTHIEEIGGSVEIASTPGQGTSVRLRIPLTLAIVPGLVVMAGGERYVIPQVSLEELIRLDGDAARSAVETLHQTPIFRHRGSLLPLVDLNAILMLKGGIPAEELSIVVLRSDKTRFGLVVDSVRDTQDIVVKPLGPFFRTLNCYSGATIMGDGGLALILDVHGLAARAGVFQADEDSRGGGSEHETGARPEHARQALLLFRAGPFQRLAIPLARVDRLEILDPSRIERAAGGAVVQHRGRILPLVFAGEMLGGSPDIDEALNVVVFRSAGQDLGLVVDEILDIVEGEVLWPRGSGCTGIAGSAIVAGSVTDFLDLDYAAATVGPARTCESLARLEAVLDKSVAMDSGVEVTA
jgi:two-component system chemotaxis sensor kinase CheA